MRIRNGQGLVPELIVVPLLLFAFALRIYHLDYQPIWSDEADMIRFANEPLPNLFRNFSRPGWNGPLYYLIVRLWLRVIGETPFAFRFFSVAISTMSVAAIFVFGKRTVGRTSGVVMSLLVATSPYLVWYSQDGKMYSLLLFLSIASTLVLLHACKQQQWGPLFLLLLLTWFSWYIHILAVLLLPFHAAVWIACNRKFSTSRMLGLFVIIGILYLPLLRWQFPTWLSSFTTGHQFYALIEIFRVQLFVFTAGYTSPAQFITIPLLFLLFVFGCASVFRMPYVKLIYLSYFFLPLISLYLISLGMPIYTDRYLIVIAPPFYGLCAIGLKTWLGHKPKILIGVTTLLVLLNCITVYLQANVIIKSAINFD